MSISLLALVDRTFWLNYILKKELRRYGLRSMFPAKTPFSTRFRGILPPSGPTNHHRGLAGGLAERKRPPSRNCLAPASWCAGSAIKRPCEPVPVTHAPEGHRPDAKRRVHRS